MAMLAFLAAFQIMFLTACSVNIPMVSDSADTEGYTDAQTMLIIATERQPLPPGLYRPDLECGGQ